jgi:hypothetical protein
MHITGTHSSRFALIPLQYLLVNRYEIKVTSHYTPLRWHSGGVELRLYTLISMADGGGCITPRPALFTAQNEPVPNTYEAWWEPEPVRTAAEMSTQKGFDRQTIQLIPSRHTDCAFPVHKGIWSILVFQSPGFINCNVWTSDEDRCGQTRTNSWVCCNTMHLAFMGSCRT